MYATHFFFIIMFSSVTGCQLQHRAHIYCRTLHLVDFVLEFQCVCVCVLRSVHFQCNRIESISVSLCFVVVFLRGKRQMPSQCSGQIKKIAIFIWTNDNRMHINLTVLHFQSIIDSGFTIDVFMCVCLCLSIRFTAKL